MTKAGFTYDAEADALYIYLGSKSGRLHSYMSERHHDVTADVVDGVLQGIEVLGASKHPVFAALLPQVTGAKLSRVWIDCNRFRQDTA